MTNDLEVGKRILVIDDELGLREGCRRALSRFGYQVDVAATGREGLAKVRSAPFGVVLIDVMMPDISGIELLSEIRAERPDTVCIIITGYATVELAVQAMKVGAHDFIAKPFSDDLLLLSVEKGLEKKALEREAQRAREMEERAERLTREMAMMQELDRVKSSFMRKVAHELRAPVAAISSLLTAVLEGYASGAKAKDIQQRAADRANELLVLIEDLLNLARLKDVKFAVRRENVFLDKVLGDVLGLHKPEAEAKKIRLSIDSRPCGAIQAEPVHIKQLWTNLVSNAIKYTPPGGQVTVRVGPEGEMLAGRVEDTGIGIAREDLPRLFEEFYRTDQAKAFAQHGTGLGLSIVKQIVEQYGGTVEVESELGKGTRVTFRLPKGSS